MRHPSRHDDPLIQPRTLLMVGAAVLTVGGFSGVALGNYTVAGMTRFYDDVRIEPRRDARVTEEWDIAQAVPADALMPAGYREDGGAY